MDHFPESIQKLIQQLSELPGIGPKSAERIVFSLLYRRADQINLLADSIKEVKNSIKKCEVCYTFDETSPCKICSDNSRSKQAICVVARPQDINVIKKTHDYKGVYFVLGGTIDPLEGITADKLNINLLLERVKKNNIVEVILALNPDMPGETTILYLAKLLKQFPKLKITRLARGLAVGSDLEYTDEVTLSNALKGRREI